MDLEKQLKLINPLLAEEILKESTLAEIPNNTEILSEGQYIKVIPIVESGIIKVYQRNEDKEILLYYIEENESCVMSFAASLNNSPSTVYATTIENTKVLLLPSDKVIKWIKQYPELNLLFFQQYKMRYSELLDTINNVVFKKLDNRIYNYLQEKSRLLKTDKIKISHREIANDLGTAREVISRIMKKLETENKVLQTKKYIQIL